MKYNLHHAHSTVRRIVVDAFTGGTLVEIIGIYLLTAVVPVLAAISDTQITDVTTRAFAVVWVSSEQTTAATVQVFSDPGGSNDVTANLTITLASPPAALLQGIAKVDVTGLDPGATVYVRTATTRPSGQILSPTNKYRSWRF
jgi:hypothetical protein